MVLKIPFDQWYFQGVQYCSWIAAHFVKPIFYYFEFRMTVGRQYTLYDNLICIKQVNMFFDKDFVNGMGMTEDKK